MSTQQTKHVNLGRIIIIATAVLSVINTVLLITITLGLQRQIDQAVAIDAAHHYEYLQFKYTYDQQHNKQGQ